VKSSIVSRALFRVVTRTAASALILAACIFATGGCEKKKTVRSGPGGPAKLKTAGADFPDDAAMIASFKKEVAAFDAKPPTTVAQYSRRGDLYVFLSKFDEAVADYEKMNELDPTQDEKNWRLGIAYYLSGDFQKAVQQFEKYHKTDGTDRETGLWHFMANAGIDGVVPAQGRMLKYEKKDRDPFPQLYELYGGATNAEEFFRTLYDAGLSNKPEVMFFAHLYAGIFEELSEHAEPAAKYLRMAYESSWGRKATGGPGYMWQIARLLVTTPPDEAADEKKPEAEKKADPEKKADAESK
jgi:lipoprotein NlpI